METFVKRILVKVQELADERYRKAVEGWTKVKSDFIFLGLRVPITRKLANEFFKELKTRGVRDIDQVLKYCDYLHTFHISELRTIAVLWSFKMKNQFELKHFFIFERWLKTYVTGWGSTDHLCVQSLGYIVYKYPDLMKEVKEWTSSSNQWVRRASAVALIYGLRRGVYLHDAFEIADKLFNDSEMYVLKGYGWMLKEAANRHRDEVFDYIMKRKKDMPRTSLRYAIEKMPEEMRKKAMS